MTTIALKDNTKRELLKIVSQLQLKFGRIVDYDEAIQYILTRFQEKDANLLMSACIEDKGSNQLLDELQRERMKDDKRYERYTRN